MWVVFVQCTDLGIENSGTTQHGLSRGRGKKTGVVLKKEKSRTTCTRKGRMYVARVHLQTFVIFTLHS
jgi:hypothetical protein